MLCSAGQDIDERHKGRQSGLVGRVPMLCSDGHNSDDRDRPLVQARCITKSGSRLVRWVPVLCSSGQDSDDSLYHMGR